MISTPLVLTAWASRRYCEFSGIPTELDDMDEFMRESVLQVAPVMAAGRMPIDIQPIVFDEQRKLVTGAVPLAASVVTGMPFATYAIENVMAQARNYPHYASKPLTELAIPEIRDPQQAEARYRHLLGTGGVLQFETIDVDRARELLGTLIASPTPELCEQLRSVRWMPTGECIIVDHSGLVVEGLKRLAAVVRTRMPMKAWVLIGAKRTLEGYEPPVIEPATFIDIMPLIEAMGAGSLEVVEMQDLGGAKLEEPATSEPPRALVGEDLEAGIAEVLALLAGACGVDALPVREEDLAWRPSTKLSTMMSQQRDIAVAARAAFSLVDPVQADQFFVSVTTGEGSPATQALRQALNRQFLTLPADEARDKVLHQVCKAWRHHCAGKFVTVLRVHKNDNFSFNYAPPAIGQSCPTPFAELFDQLEILNVPNDIAYEALRAVLTAIGITESLDAIFDNMTRLIPFFTFADHAYDVALDRKCNPVAFIAAVAVAAMDYLLAERMSQILDAISKGTLLSEGDPLLTLRNWICANIDLLAESPATLAAGFLAAVDASYSGRDIALSKAKIQSDLPAVLKDHYEAGSEVQEHAA